MANYDVIEGNRKDSFIFVNGAYSYRRDKGYNGIRYLRCTKFRDSARARICVQSNVFSIKQEHDNHETAETQVEIRRFYQNISGKQKIPSKRYLKFLMKK